MGNFARRQLPPVLAFASFLAVFAGESAFAQACDAQGLRVGGEPGDNYIGPTCNQGSTHRTCFYITGQDLPAAAGGYYKIFIEGVEYPLSFNQQISPTEVVACTSTIPYADQAYDVEVQLEADCGIAVPDLYQPPLCCTVDTIRVGGEPGDNYIGPTCNEGSTHRTCLYVNGDNLPPAAGDYYKLFFGGVEYPLAFSQQLNSDEVVACASAIAYSDQPYDVEVQLDPGCGLATPALYDPPLCCAVENVRLGGQPGDNYVGPVCNGDGTYRSCYYAEGFGFAQPVDPYYQIELNAVQTPVALDQRIDSATAVACATSLTPYQHALDVGVSIDAGCAGVTEDLYEGTSMCQCLLDPDEAEACAASEVLLTVEKIVVNDDGGTLQVDDFPLFVGGTPVTSGEKNSFPEGTYAVTETGDPGYGVTYGGACAPDGTVNLTLGPGVTCTITNDDIAPTLTVIKNLEPPSDPGRFTLWITDGGGVVASLDDVGDGGTLGPVALDAGDYTVGEDGYGGTNLGDYLAVIGGDCAADGTISLALAEDRTCTIDNGRREVYFLVQKHFTDGNPGSVTAQLTCQTGLPLIQTFDVSESDFVNFVLTNYSPGDLNCRVQEITGGTNGYAATYVADVQYGGAGAIRSEIDGCYFDAIQFGQFTCDLTNELEAVDLTVYKQWYGVEVANYLHLEAAADYTCYNVRSGPDSETETRGGSLYFEGALDSEVVEDLYPDWDGSSYCTVNESSAISGAEVDDGDCADVPLVPGGGNECTIVNTVFFEGIPALGRDALLVLGLVVLVAGLIGVRRIA